MSRGPGLIQRRLIAIFEKTPELPLSTRQLCRKVYGIRNKDIKKKHRVAVLRAIKRIADPAMPQSRALPSLRRVVVKGDRDDVWFVYSRTGSHQRPPANSAPANNKRPRKHKRKLPTILARLIGLPPEERLEFIADMDEFPLVVIPNDMIEPCLPMAHLLKPDIRERLLKRLDHHNTGVWKLLRKRLEQAL